MPLYCAVGTGAAGAKRPREARLIFIMPRLDIAPTYAHVYGAF